MHRIVLLDFNGSIKSQNMLKVKKNLYIISPRGAAKLVSSGPALVQQVFGDINYHGFLTISSNMWILVHKSL